MDEEGRRVPVIAKVEKPQAVDNMEDVVAAFDAVMVARGDLAVEYPLEKVPVVQKRLIEMCRRNAKPVIVATQMMESMITNSRPTRAEASDVANAILDGADAVMLSAESVGRQVPDRDGQDDVADRRAPPRRSCSQARPRSRWRPARSRGPRAARWPVRRPSWPTSWTPRRWWRSPSPVTPPAVSPATASPVPVLAFTTDAATRNQLALTWGVRDAPGGAVNHTDAMVDLVDTEMLKLSEYGEGDTVIITAGSPPDVPGTTNMVRVHHLGGGHSS